MSFRPRAAACVIGLMALACHDAALAQNLSLVCYGEQTRTGVAPSTRYEWDDRRQRYRLRESTQLEQQQIDAAVMVQIVEGAGRIRLPPSLIPALNSGGVDGWWPLDGLRVGQDDIQASYRMNGLNQPKVLIDRVSGHITVDGVEHFKGTCDKVDPGGARRF